MLNGRACTLLAAAGVTWVACDTTAIVQEAPPTNTARPGTDFVLSQTIDAPSKKLSMHGVRLARATSKVSTFTVQGGVWSPEATIPLDGVASAISLFGERLLVAVDGQSETTRLDAFRHTPNGWLAEGSPIPDLGAVGAVEQSELFAAVGVPGGGAVAGAVHLLVRSGDAWTLEQVLSAPAPEVYDGFGHDVALSGSTLAVCAYQEDAGFATLGAVHLYERSPSGWNETTALAGSTACGSFCDQVALEDDVLVIAGCEVRTFTRSGATWSEDATTAPSLPAIDLSLAGQRLLVGGQHIDVLRRGSGEWTLEESLAVGSPIEQSDGWIVGRGVGSTLAFFAEVGAACTTASECPAGFCVDGFCCDNTCDSACTSCDVAGSLGHCTPVDGQPRPGHPECEATCVDDHTLRGVGSCGGALTGCDPGALADCTPYRCDAGRCLDGCNANTDCATNNVCVEGVCVADVRTCVDEHTVGRVTGERVDCAPFRCKEGACLVSCDSTDDCSLGSVCTSDGDCAAPAPRAELTGCSCSLSGDCSSDVDVWRCLVTSLVVALLGRWTERFTGRARGRRGRRGSTGRKPRFLRWRSGLAAIAGRR